MRVGKKQFTTTQLIVLSFLAVIFIGACLLTLPAASANGKATSFMDALFTATTSVCVTGLVTVTTASHWSTLGHVLILILIQIGGMGVIAITTIVMMLMGKKLSLKNRMLLGDAFNLDTLKGLVKFLKRVFKGTFLVEGIGALCYMPVFIPEYGLMKGIWYSIFHAISAFCNAGIDIIGPDSFMPYVNHIWMNLVTMTLIVLGGIGFIVWFDVLLVIKEKFQRKRRGFGVFRALSLHSKIVICMTVILIVSGAVLILIFEYNNPDTIGNFTFGEKVLAAFFQSVTTRTAGFATISQKGLTHASVIVCLPLMFIGGSSVGTAGGVKTSTIAILILSVMATVRGEEDITCFGRRISAKTVQKAIAVVVISFLVSVVALVALRILESGESADIVFEVYSALGTAGLTRNYTSTVGLAGKMILCICMYLGRIGPITMVIAFTMKRKQAAFRLPEENVTVG